MFRKISKTPSVLASILGVTMACADDATGPEGLPDCSGSVTVGVGPGTSPVFSWEPACRLFLILVEPAGSGEDLWLILSEGENRIAPGVRYGIVPAGAIEREPPAALEAGITYEILVGRFTGPGDDDGELIGMAEFTP